MTIELNFPLYLIPLGNGYVSVMDAGAEEPQFLAVFSAEAIATEFMQRCEIAGSPRPLASAREFAWLLQSLHHPVTQVAFDPEPEETTLTASWKLPVAELLQKHLVTDYSPWKYPLFVVDYPTGLASITGQAPDGSQWAAVCLFSSRETAEEYLQGAGDAGELRSLDDVPAVRAVLSNLSENTAAVALDAHADGVRRTAKYCLPVHTVLEKYLIKQSEETDGD